MDRPTRLILIVALLLSTCGAQAEVVAKSPQPRRADVDQAESMLLTANGLLERGLHDLAANEYRAFLADHPDHPEVNTARYGLAVCLYQSGDIAAGIELLKALNRLNEFAFATDGKVMLGQSLLATGDAAGALVAIQQEPTIKSDHPLAEQAALITIEAQFALGRFAETAQFARALLSGAAKQDVSSRAAYLLVLSLMELERFDDAVHTLGKLDLSGFDATVAAHLMLVRAECLERLDRVGEAIKWYTRVVDSRAPSFVAPARLAAARLMRADGQSSDAAKMIEPLLESDETETLASAHMLAGQIAVEQNRLDEALAHFRTAGAASDSVARRAQFQAAQCLLRLERFAEAAEAFAEFSRDHPESDWAADATFNRSAALINTGELDEADKALAAFVIGNARNAKIPDALYLQTWIAHRQGDHQRAAKLADQFLTGYGDHPHAVDAMFIAAESAFLNDELSIALDLFTKFYDQYSTDSRRVFAAFCAGIAAYRLDQFDDAVTWLAKTSIDGARTAPDYVQGLFVLGDIAFAREKWNDAATQLSVFVSLSKDEALAADALLKIGIASRRMSKPRRSLTALDQLLDQYPDSPLARRATFERGLTLRELGESAAAIKALKDLSSGNEDDELTAHARYQMGLLTIDQGDYSRAADLLEIESDDSIDAPLAAETRFQRCAALMAMEEYEGAAGCYERFIVQFEDHIHRPMAEAERAIALARFRRDKEAIKAIERILNRRANELSPELRAQLWYEKAWCCRSLDDLDGAAGCYESLLSEAPKTNLLRNTAALELAEIVADRGDASAARKLLEPICNGHDTQAPEAGLLRRANYRLALCDFADERWTDAAIRFGEVIQLADGDEVALSSSYYRGEALFRAGRPSDAIAPLQRVVDADKKDEAYRASLLRLAECLSIEQQWPQGQSTFERFLAEYPDDGQAYVAQFGRGWASEHQGHIDQAITSYRQVAANHQNETAARAQFQIGECLFAQDNYQDAVIELLKVDIQFAYPKWSAAALYEAGRALELLNKNAEARLQFESVIERFADSEWASLAKQQLKRMRQPNLPGHASAKEDS